MKERLQKFVQSQGLSIFKLEKMCDFSNGSIAKSNKIGTLRIEKILATFPQLSRTWLLTGEGEMLNTSTSVRQTNVHGDNISNSVINHYKKIREEGHTLPVFPAERLRDKEVNINGYLEEHKDDIEYISIDQLIAEANICYRVSTSSMRPYFNEGDMLLLKRLHNNTEDIIEGRCYVVNSRSHGVFIRVLAFTNDDKIKCFASLSRGTEEFTIDKKDVICVFSIVCAIKDNVSSYLIGMEDHLNEVGVKDRQIQELRDMNEKLMNNQSKLIDQLANLKTK